MTGAVMNGWHPFPFSLGNIEHTKRFTMEYITVVRNPPAS
jgi:hypothetical protein